MWLNSESECGWLYLGVDKIEWKEAGKALKYTSCGQLHGIENAKGLLTFFTEDKEWS